MAEPIMSPRESLGNRPCPQPKIDLLRAAMDAGDWRAAIGIAAKFPRLGTEKEAITRAQSAYLNPDFYRQLGQDPDVVIAEGISALRRRYGGQKP